MNVKQAFKIKLNKEKLAVSNLNNVLVFKDIDLGTGYYYFGLNAKGIKNPIKAEIRKGSEDGTLLGTLIIKHDGISETFLRNAANKTDIYIVFKDLSDEKVIISSMRFFAGSPKK